LPLTLPTAARTIRATSRWRLSMKATSGGCRGKLHRGGELRVGFLSRAALSSHRTA
jgi:hypothetical protein